MFKKLGKKALTIIMATMLVASMGAVSTSAVEVATEESAIEATSTTSSYVDEISGVKLESDELNFEDVTVMILDNSLMAEYVPGLFEKAYTIEIYTEDFELVDLSETSVTAYLPCENEGYEVGYVSTEIEDTYALASEYVDGCYKIELFGNGDYVICDYFFVDGTSDMIEQTLTDETTGISVSGMIETDSMLAVVDVVKVLEDLVGMLEEMASAEGAELDFDTESLGALKDIEGYLVYPVRNLFLAKTDGELTVSLPSELEGYEVRNMDILSEKVQNGDYSELEEYADVLSEEAFNTKTNEEIAEDVNALIDTLLAKLTSEYTDGKYVVNTESLGLFLVVPENSFYVTADDVQVMREEMEKLEVEEPTEAPTQAPTTPVTNTVVDNPTQPQQTVVQNTTATQATTAQTTGKGAVATGNGANVLALAMALGTATTAIFAFRKKRLSK